MMIRKHLLLMEMHNLHMTLMENRMAFLSKTFSKKLEDRFNADMARMPAEEKNAILSQEPENLGDKIIAYVATFDPDRAKKNTQWLLDLIIKKNIQWEDFERAQRSLIDFMRLKNSLPVDKRDIRKFATLADMEVALEEILQTEKENQLATSQRQIDKKLDAEMRAESKILLDTAKYRILVPLTTKASCYFGVNTKWCTTQEDGRMFNHYTKQGPLYIVLDKPNNRRWQFHFESNQFMDEMDRQIDLSDFIREHPEVAKFFDFVEIGSWRRFIIFHTPDAIYFREGGLSSRSKRATLVIKDNNIQPASIVDLSAGYYPDAVENDGVYISSVLNKVGVGLDPKADQIFAPFGVFYNNGKWGDQAEVGDKIISTDDSHTWMGVSREGHIYAALVEGTDEIIWDVLIRDNEVLAPILEIENAGDHLLKLLLSIDRELRFSDKRYFDADEFTEEQARIIIEKKPSLANIKMLLKGLGADNEIFKKHFVEKLYNMDFGDAEVVGSDVILHEYKTINDLISSHGDRTAKYVLGIVDGDHDFDTYEKADRNTMNDLLETLDPEALAKVGAYFLENYPDEAAEIDFEPTSIQMILDLHDDVEDDDFQSACDSAYSDGLRIGAENDATKSLVRGVESLPVLFKHNDKWTTKFMWDVPVALAPPISEVVDAINDDEDGLENEGSWFSYTSMEISVDEPRYGFSGYDEDVAKERFGAAIYDFIDR